MILNLISRIFYIKQGHFYIVTRCSETLGHFLAVRDLAYCYAKMSEKHSSLFFHYIKYNHNTFTTKINLSAHFYSHLIRL